MIDIDELEKMLRLHSGVFDDVATRQLPGWGASNFLIHEGDEPFEIAAEWRSGSGSCLDRDYATRALRTFHLLARAYIALREDIQRGECDGDRRYF